MFNQFLLCVYIYIYNHIITFTSLWHLRDNVNVMETCICVNTRHQSQTQFTTALFNTQQTNDMQQPKPKTKCFTFYLTEVYDYFSSVYVVFSLRLYKIVCLFVHATLSRSFVCMATKTQPQQRYQRCDSASQFNDVVRARQMLMLRAECRLSCQAHEWNCAYAQHSTTRIDRRKIEYD